MLPASFQTPAAVVLLAGGIISCFAGYRFFRVVLGILGFYLGAAMASGAVGSEHTAWMIAAAIGGGLIGALVLLFAYFVGVALLGAGIGAGIAALIWAQFGSEPGAVVTIVFAIAGALAALALQRLVIVGATAVIGSWIITIAAASLVLDRAASRAATNGVWIPYPMNPAPGNHWIYVVWLALAVAGIFVQLSFTAKGRK
jgi:hypothetical protein